MWPPLPKTNQSLSWQTSRSYAPSENVFCFLRSGKHFPPFPCAITFSNPLCYCHDYHYCHHCHRTTTTIDIEANGVLPSMNHGRCWEGAALESDEAARALVPRLSFFFFFNFFFLLSLIRADSALICVEPGQFGQNRVVSAGDRNGRNRPKSALNHAGTAKIGFEWGPNILNLSFLNFILNICCFFCVFFFVLCFLPSSFFVLWIKA